jgi:hypothetical protein
MNFIESIVDQHKEFESPISFWFWSAVVSISAVLKDNVYIDRYIYKLYPNIYVMLHADSGIKKGPPISLARTLTKGLCNQYVGRSSIQGILKDMGTSSTLPGGKFLDKTKSFICSSELTSSIVDDKVALTILTDLYDRNYNQGDWKSLLKMEFFSLVSPTISMFTATNEAQGDELFLRKDVQGGFFARTFIIHESKRNKINSLMYKPEHLPNLEEAREYLKALSKLNGEVIIEDDAKHYYDNWYKEFSQAVDDNKIKDPTGTLNRFGDSVLKVALNLALGKRPELIIKEEDIVDAIMNCEKLVGNVRRTTMGRGKSAWANEKALVMIELIDRPDHKISRKQLNKKYWANAQSEEWDKIMESLQVAGVIEFTNVGSEIVYYMPENQVEEIRKHLKGK